ncbi:MAG TPA: Wzz/FepE/Etk N-terminal domain-containing protein [Solirubrobacteraceae bacterium]|nr:Wzz/FepE/Etk N-terminal domain-containing protein [Solirubrobacteraceae bacterium]
MSTDAKTSSEVSTSSSDVPAPAPVADLVDLRRFVRRHVTVILLFVVSGTALGGVRAAAGDEIYEASTTILFTNDPVARLAGFTDDFSDVGDPTQPGSTMQTRLRLIEQRSIAVAVTRQVGAEESPEELLGRVRAEQDVVSSLARVVARADTAGGAARLANVWARTFVSAQAREREEAFSRGIMALRRELPATRGRERLQLARRLGRLRTIQATNIAPVRLVTEARPPSEPVGVKWTVGMASGFLVGLVLGFGAGFLRDRLSGSTTTIARAGG